MLDPEYSRYEGVFPWVTRPTSLEIFDEWLGAPGLSP